MARSDRSKALGDGGRDVALGRKGSAKEARPPAGLVASTERQTRVITLPFTLSPSMTSRRWSAARPLSLRISPVILVLLYLPYHATLVPKFTENCSLRSSVLATPGTIEVLHIHSVRGSAPDLGFRNAPGTVMPTARRNGDDSPSVGGQGDDVSFAGWATSERLRGAWVSTGRTGLQEERSKGAICDEGGKKKGVEIWKGSSQEFSARR